MARFVGVAHPAQVRMARDAGVVAFGHGREASVRRLAPGDSVIDYAPKSDFDGDPVQAFVAHATVTGDAPFVKEWAAGFTAWARTARFDEVTERPVRPLLERLSFIRDRRHWGMAFRQDKFEIGEADHATIAGALLGARR